MRPERDVLTVLADDHRAIEELFRQVEDLRGDDLVRRRKALVDRVIIELVRHSTAEEAQVYPAVRAKVNPEIAERALHDHVEAERTMQLLSDLAPDAPGYSEELAELIAQVRQHIAEEEETIFPLMRGAFTPDELRTLGRKVQRTERIAPTRPHPHAPKRTPEVKLLGPLAGMLDRLRDAIGNRGAGA